MHSPGLLGWVKMSDIEIVQIVLIEHSDLKGFGYDLSDTQDGLSVGKCDNYFPWGFPLKSDAIRMQAS